IRFLRDAVEEMAFSTDIIVGFPGETEEDFQATLDLVREVGFAQVYAFCYSPRPGTEAARATDTIPREIQEERLQRLLGLQEVLSRQANDRLVGRTLEVLVDGASRLDGDVPKGRTRCNRIVHLPANLPPGSRFLEARIVRAHPHSLTGEPRPAPP